MKEYLEILRTVRLFGGIDTDDLASMLVCMRAKTVTLKKAEPVITAGNPVHFVGVVLHGQLHIIREDSGGERALIATLTQGEFFGEALCCAGVKESPVSVLADTEATVMLLAFSHLLQTCSKACPFHTKLIENMLQIIAQKNIQLQERMDLLGKKTIRSRLLSYFEVVAAQQGRDFTIPLNREEMADFLCIDRSALSRELGKLQKEGIIAYRKNRFRYL